jgi:ribose transport system permease protein
LTPKSKFRFLPRGGASNLLFLVLAWLIIFGLFSLKAPSFHTARNIEQLLRESAIVSMSAIGMTFVIVAGGIDLSVGSIAAFSCTLVAWALQAKHSPTVAMLFGVLGGAAWGLANGLVITKMKVTPFIVTLGSLLLIRGAALGLANENSIYPQATWLNSLLEPPTGAQAKLILPIGVWLVLLLAALAAFVLGYTKFGRHVIAVGSNENAARLCGVPVERIGLLVYTISGLFAGLAGMLLFTRLTIGDPTSADGQELDVIAGVVIGGASLLGGEGSVAGSLIGVLIMETLRAGGTQMALPSWAQRIATGAIIVLAVGLDRLRVRRAT